jgi:hypothetical protein
MEMLIMPPFGIFRPLLQEGTTEGMLLQFIEAIAAHSFRAGSGFDGLASKRHRAG